MNNFVSYKEVPLHKLNSIAEVLTNLDTKSFRNHIEEDFLNHYSGAGRLRNDLDFTIKKEPLESIENAMLMVEFNTHPFASHPYLFQLVGQARLLNISGVSSITPIIYIFPNKEDTTMEHEKVHLCQYLLDSAYPLTHEQRKIFMDPKDIVDGTKYFVENSGKKGGVKYVINQACYQTWIEFEAYFFTRDTSTELDCDSAFEIIKSACRSATPIVSLEKLLEEECETEVGEALSKVLLFYDEMEKSVSWVKELVKMSGGGSLRLAIERAHFEIQIDSLDINSDELDETFARDQPKVGRNDPCPCGSNKKYKKCCGKG